MSVKKVLMINPPTPGNRKFTRNIGCAAESKAKYLYKPVDFMILSGVLRQKANLKWIDCVGDNLNEEEAFQEIESFKPDIVISSIIDALFVVDFNFLKALKERWPKCKYYVFGDSFIEEKNAQKVIPHVDGIIVDPYLLNADMFLSDALSADRVSGLRTENHYEKVDKKSNEVSVGIPDHSMFLNEFYQWPFAKEKRYTIVSTAWSCPYSCSYCPAAQFPFHYRPVKEVVRELEEVASLGIKEVFFSDYSFGYPKEITDSLLDEMIKREIDLGWSAYFHPNRFEPEFMQKMKAAGCHTIIIGVESKNMELLKQFNRNTKEETIQNLIKECHKLGIEVCGDFLFGLKGQDKDEILNSINYSKELKLDYASFNIVAPLPGTSIRKEATELGLLKDDGHHYDSLGGQNVLSLGVLSENELRKIRNKAVVDFYFRPLFLLKKIVKFGSFKEVFHKGQEFIHLVYKNFIRK